MSGYERTTVICTRRKLCTAVRVKTVKRVDVDKGATVNMKREKSGEVTNR